MILSIGFGHLIPPLDVSDDSLFAIPTL
jgi:hypothetical protein